MTRENQPTREIILPPTAKMGVDKLTEKQKFQAVSLWQEEQLKALSRPVTKRQLEMVSHLPPTESWNSVLRLPVPNYQPDRAVRAAILDPQGWKRWKKEDAAYWAYRYPMNPTHTLQVYLGGPRPPLFEEAKEIVERFRLSMILNSRICLSIWLGRRRDEHLTQTGSALINLDEILAIRGVKKSRTVVHKGEQTTISYSNGYRWEDKQAIIDDLTLLQQCYIQGACVINVNGQWEDLGVEDDQYLRFSLLTKRNERGIDERVGIFVTPGNWLNLHEAKNTFYIAEVEREVFKLNPQQDYHELLVGLALTERWRDLARKQDYAKPISMQGLLEASVITVNKHNPSRFIKRITDALDALFEKGILGAPAKCLTPIDQTKSRWTGEWLASQWVLLPPKPIIEYYQQSIAASPLMTETIPIHKQRPQRRRKE